MKKICRHSGDLIGEGETVLEVAERHKAVLQGASLKCAHLSCADLTGADLRGSDLRWANLKGVHEMAKRELDMATDFQPTHIVEPSRGEPYSVMLEDEGRAYTRAEWEAYDQADLELADGEWWHFQGKPFTGRVTKIPGD